jgi:hypothetical protein
MTPSYAYDGLDLLFHHAELLASSVISPEMAKMRGYRSIEKKAELKALSFSDAQCRVPALRQQYSDVFPVRWGGGGADVGR